MINSIPRFKYYVSSIFLGSAFNLLLLVIILNALGFKGKSLISLIFISIVGYFFKAIIFYIPFFYFNNTFASRSPGEQKLIFFSPFLLFLTWFAMIIIFQIESLAFEISYGYTDRFPHCFIQLIATLVVCILIKSRVRARIAKL